MMWWHIRESQSLTCRRTGNQWFKHYSGVIMGAMASQITSLTIVYSTVYSGADERKHQSSASLAVVWGIHRGEFPAQRASNAENVSIWWRHHEKMTIIFLVWVVAWQELCKYTVMDGGTDKVIHCKVPRTSYTHNSFRKKMKKNCTSFFFTLWAWTLESSRDPTSPTVIIWS